MNKPLINNLPLKITAKALEKIKFYAKLLQVDQSDGLRIGVKKEGESQKKILGFDKKRFTDEKFNHADQTIFIDRRELTFFENVTLDFKETSSQKGFVFREPKK